MQRVKFLLLIITTIFATSCAKRVETIEKIDMSNGGAIRLNIEPSAALSKASTVPTPTADEFMITIASTTADESGAYPVVYEKQYGEMPIAIVMKEGEYRVTATSGAHETFSTTAPTYSASTTTTVEIGQTSDISLTATISSYLVDIVYTEEFKAAFTDYYVEAHVIDDRYTFAAMGDQCAYFAPGSVKIVLKGMTAAGQAYSSVIKEISSVGRERYILTLAIRPQGHAFDVLVDTQVEQIGVSGELDPSLYPDMPEIVSGSLSYTETILTTAGDPNSTINFGAIANIGDVELTFTSDNISYLGIEPNRVYHINNAEDVAALNASGFIVNASEIIGKHTAKIDMSSFSNMLLSFNNEQTKYTATIKVSGVLDETAQKELTFTVDPPQFTLDAITPGRCWSRSVNVPVLNVTKGDINALYNNGKLRFELQTQGSPEWITLAPTTELKDLMPNTTYSLRGVYRDGQITTAIHTFTTESVPQVPNAGMEDWKIDYFKSYHHYKPWNDNVAEWWNTSNPRCFTYNGICNQYNSPTSVLYTKDNAISGGKTAEIRSVKIDVGGRENVVGKLLIGTLTSGSPNGWVSGKNNPEYITAGRPFNARPDKVRFWIKYDQYGDDNYVITIQVKNGDTVIGEKEVTGNAISEYTKMTVDIPYTNTELKATSLYICFASSSNSSFPNQKIDVLYPDGSSSGWKAFVGSILYIDDVELLYK